MWIKQHSGNKAWIHIYIQFRTKSTRVSPVVQWNEVEIGDLDRRPKLHKHKPNTTRSTAGLTAPDVWKRFSSGASQEHITGGRNLRSSLRSAHRCSPEKQSKENSCFRFTSRTTDHGLTHCSRLCWKNSLYITNTCECFPTDVFRDWIWWKYVFW